MYKKMFKLFMCAFMLGLLITNYSNAQGSGTSATNTATSPYPIFTLSPLAGAIFPLSELGNNFKAGFSAGLDAGLRLNKELALYTKVGYYSLTTNTQGAPNSRYIEISAGPRYYFSSRNLKSTFFLETGVGAYIFSQDAYDINGVSIEKKSNTNVGLNVGPGATLQLSKSMDVILKSKYHMVFNSEGTRSFIAALGGLEFKF